MLTMVCFVVALPPSIQYEIAFQRNRENTVSVNLNWNDSFTNDYGVDKYCIQFSSSIITSCMNTTCLIPNTSYVCTDLKAGHSYELVVQASNCVDQFRSDSRPLVITPECKLL